MNKNKLLSLGILFVFLGAPQLFSDQSTRQTPVVKVIQKYGNAVVNISTERVVMLRKQHPFWGTYGQTVDSLLENYMSTQTMNALKSVSIGSGVVVREDGIIATNAHVVHMANSIYVTLSNGKRFEANLILVNPNEDLAFLKIQSSEKLNSVRLADPNQLMIGETVIAVGNPFGLENSVSVGVISGKNRNLNIPNMQHQFKDLIQTDASINIGSSGGALFNLDGELVGVNLGIIQEAQNIGFVVPAYKIKEGLQYYDTYGVNKESAKTKSGNSSSTKSVRVPVN